MAFLSTKQTGILLVVFSAIVFSTAGLFVKSVAAGAWDVIFWRGVFAVIFSTAFVALRGHMRQEFLCLGKAGWVAAIFSACGTAAFVPAFKLTTIANVTLIYAAAPIFAGVLAWIFARETLDLRRISAVITCFLGVLIIVSGSLGGLHVQGDLLALFMTFMMATIMVVYRVAPDTPAAGPVIISSIFLLVPSAYFGAPFAVSMSDLWLLAVFGLVFAVAAITLMEGARRISATQTALLSVLETPLAPLLAVLVLAEMPALATLIGGSIVFAAVIYAQFDPQKD